MSDRDDLARLLEQHPAYSTGNDQQDWFKAREAADAIIAARWVPGRDIDKVVGVSAERITNIAAERDALAETVARVREWAMINEIDEPPLDWRGLGDILHAAPSDPEGTT